MTKLKKAKRGWARKWVGSVVEQFSHHDEAVNWRDPISGRSRGDSRFTRDETMALVRELTSMIEGSFDIKRPMLELRSFFPTRVGSDPWAQTRTYKQFDFVGSARKIKNYSDDLPIVNAVGREFTKKVHSYGDAFVVSFEDLRAAAHLNRPIQSDLVAVARRAFDESVEQVAAFGDPDDMAPWGFFNCPFVPIVAPITGTWLTATADQIIGDLTPFWESIPIITVKTHRPNSLLFDTLSWAYLGRKIGTDDGGTIRKWIRENLEPTPQRIDVTSLLDLADLAGTGPRVVAYEYNETNGWIDIPMDFQVHSPVQKNLAFESAGEGKCTGVIFPYPLSMAYLDGI